MNTDLFVPQAEIATATGLTEVQVRKDIKAGRLPGTVRGRKTLVLRAEWNKYLAGEWQQPAPRPVVGVHSRGKAA